jgi:hypothetical protein
VKVLLTQALVVRLSISERPAPGLGGKVLFEANPGLKPYIVFDEHRHAPPGFGVRVHPSGKKTYIVQRRVGSRVLKVKVADVRDGPLDQVRERAQTLTMEMTRLRDNPNRVAREADIRKAAARVPLRDILDGYRQHLITRANRKAKPSTLKVLDACARRLATLMDVPIGELRSTQILHLFDEGAQ